jgi:hypothetical protein
LNLRILPGIILGRIPLRIPSSSVYDRLEGKRFWIGAIVRKLLNDLCIK